MKASIRQKLEKTAERFEEVGRLLRNDPALEREDGEQQGGERHDDPRDGVHCWFPLLSRTRCIMSRATMGPAFWFCPVIKSPSQT